MGEETAIAWTHKTFNIAIGCHHAPADELPVPDRTAPECDNCYAETFDHRLGGAHWGPGAALRLLSAEYWSKPLRWNAAAEARGERVRVFCSSMTDWALPGPVMDGLRVRLRLIRETPWIDWQLLTKHGARHLAKLLPWMIDGTPAWPNVWVGVTCGVRSSLWRVHRLREIRAAVRFISGEPLLEEITAEDWDGVLQRRRFVTWDDGDHSGMELPSNPVHWLIIGDESGRRRRPAKRAWVETARDAAARHRVAFFFKQWNGEIGDGIEGERKGTKGTKGTIHLPLLRGRPHDDFPEPDR